MIANDNAYDDNADLAQDIAAEIHRLATSRGRRPGDAVIATSVALGSMISEYAVEGGKEALLRNVVALLWATADVQGGG